MGLFLAIYCHVCALFVNGKRIATHCHVYEWDVAATRFLRQHGELSLANSTAKAATGTSTPLTAGYTLGRLNPTHSLMC